MTLMKWDFLDLLFKASRGRCEELLLDHHHLPPTHSLPSALLYFSGFYFCVHACVVVVV